MNAIRAWFTDHWKLSKEDAAKATNFVLLLALVAVLGCILGLMAFASQWADPNGEFWPLVIRAQKELLKGYGDVGRSLVVLLLSIAEWWGIESSPLGRRWMIYHMDEDGNFTEPVEIRAQKKRNGVLVFAALLVANAFIFHVGI